MSIPSTGPSQSSSQTPSIGLVVPGFGPAPADGHDSGAFRQCLLDNLEDGIIFVSSQRRILVWNEAIESMTGMLKEKVERLELTPSLLGLADAEGQIISENGDPLAECFREEKQITGEFTLIGRSGRLVKVEMRFVPVKSTNGQLQGAVVMIHDVSAQIDLQRQLDDLYEFSVVDPLTQVANRAEFERALDEYVRAHHANGFQCSIIICDIDFFKQVNDNYNHHIGDQALIAFATILKEFVREKDVVGRYGGEEFVILCANCNQESAVERAEEIRVALTRTPQPMLDGKCITASFGVSEMRDGDSATDFFVRADNALLRAKELGRNRVVEAGIGDSDDEKEMKIAEITSLSGVKWRDHESEPLICEEYRTRTPMTVIVEKLRGYITETKADIRCVESDYASMIVEFEDSLQAKRKGVFVVDIEFQEQETDEGSQTQGKRKRTFIRIRVWEGKRKWFATNTTDLAPEVVREMCRYFMINDESSKLRVAPAATEPASR